MPCNVWLLRHTHASHTQVHFGETIAPSKKSAQPIRFICHLAIYTSSYRHEDLNSRQIVMTWTIFQKASLGETRKVLSQSDFICHHSVYDMKTVLKCQVVFFGQLKLHGPALVLFTEVLNLLHSYYHMHCIIAWKIFLCIAEHFKKPLTFLSWKTFVPLSDKHAYCKLHATPGHY